MRPFTLKPGLRVNKALSVRRGHAGDVSRPSSFSMPLNRDGYRASDVPDGVAASDAVDCWNCASRPGGSAPLA